MDQNRLTGVISPIAAQRGWAFRAVIPIVVAIIAVLVAIAIPMFANQLEKAREATDAANIRSAYAEVMAAAVSGDEANYSKKVELRQQESGWQNSFDFPSNLTAGTTEPAKGGEVTITYTPATGSGEGTCAVNITLAQKKSE